MHTAFFCHKTIKSTVLLLVLPSAYISTDCKVLRFIWAEFVFVGLSLVLFLRCDSEILSIDFQLCVRGGGAARVVIPYNEVWT